MHTQFSASFQNIKKKHSDNKNETNMRKIILAFLFIFGSIFAQSGEWVSKGIGGGGAFFVPSISPFDDNEFFTVTDMSAVFRSGDGGETWETINFTQIKASTICGVQFTSDADLLYGIDGGDYPKPVYSQDGGETWTAIPEDPTNNETFYFYADETNTDRLIISNYSSMFFSNDAGNSFTEIFNTSEGGGVLVSGTFWSGDLILIGTNFGIYESTDGGATFSFISNLSLPDGEGIVSFSASEQNGTIRLYCVTLDDASVYAGVTGADYQDFRGIYKYDYGTKSNWVNISGSLPSDMKAFFASTSRENIDIVYVAGGDVSTAFPAVFKSTDSGSTWSEIFKTNNNENIYTGWSGYHGDYDWWWGEYALGFAVSRANPDVAILTDLGYVHSTTDGGATWKQNYVNPADQNPINQPTPKGKNYRGVGLENTSVWHMTWLDQNNIFAGFADIAAIRTTDGGTSWSKKYNDLNINSVYMTIYNSADNLLYAATSTVHDVHEETRLDDYMDSGDGDVRVSSDGGENWSALYDFGMPVVWIAFANDDANGMYAAVAHSVNGGIYRCDNVSGAPDVWTKLANPPRTEGHPFNIHLLNDGTIVANYSGRINPSGDFTASSGVFVSTDNGVSWQDRSSSEMLYWTKDLTIDPSDPNQNTWYASVFSGWGGPPNDLGGLYKTTDRGVSWTIILDKYRVSSCAIDPNNHERMIVASATEGLWFTENLHSKNPQFEFAEEYPFFHPTRIFFDPYAPENIWVVSFGNGIRLGNISLLPVELISFAGHFEKGKVILEWETATETNNKGFQIERRKESDKSDWERIAFVGGAGTSASRRKYSFADEEIETAKYFYRLKQIDFDGGFHYSNEIKINASVPARFELSQNYPNPFGKSASSAGITTIDFTLPQKSFVRLTLYNELGETVRVLLNEQREAGFNKFSFDASNLSSGVYFYELKTKGFSASKKMLIIN